MESVAVRVEPNHVAVLTDSDCISAVVSNEPKVNAHDDDTSSIDDTNEVMAFLTGTDHTHMPQFNVPETGTDVVVKVYVSKGFPTLKLHVHSWIVRSRFALFRASNMGTCQCKKCWRHTRPEIHENYFISLSEMLPFVADLKSSEIDYAIYQLACHAIMVIFQSAYPASQFIYPKEQIERWTAMHPSRAAKEPEKQCVPQHVLLHEMVNQEVESSSEKVSCDESATEPWAPAYFSYPFSHRNREVIKEAQDLEPAVWIICASAMEMLGDMKMLQAFLRTFNQTIYSYSFTTNSLCARMLHFVHTEMMEYSIRETAWFADSCFQRIMNGFVCSPISLYSNMEHRAVTTALNGDPVSASVYIMDRCNWMFKKKMITHVQFCLYLGAVWPGISKVYAELPPDSKIEFSKEIHRALADQSDVAGSRKIENASMLLSYILAMSITDLPEAYIAFREVMLSEYDSHEFTRIVQHACDTIPAFTPAYLSQFGEARARNKYTVTSLVHMMARRTSTILDAAARESMLTDPCVPTPIVYLAITLVRVAAYSPLVCYNHVMAPGMQVDRDALEFICELLHVFSATPDAPMKPVPHVGTIYADTEKYHMHARIEPGTANDTAQYLTHIWMTQGRNARLVASSIPDDMAYERVYDSDGAMRVMPTGSIKDVNTVTPNTMPTYMNVSNFGKTNPFHRIFSAAAKLFASPQAVATFAPGSFSQFLDSTALFRAHMWMFPTYEDMGSDYSVLFDHTRDQNGCDYVLCPILLSRSRFTSNHPVALFLLTHPTEKEASYQLLTRIQDRKQPSASIISFRW